VDACQGVVCPGGAACDKGVCADPTPGGSVNADGSVPGGGDSGTGPGVILGTGGNGNGGTAGGTGTTAGASTDPGDPGRRGQAASSGCGCRLGPAGSSWLAAAGALALAAMWVVRRRRAK
jgi:MYXO-CTERM domain-containing protein